MYTVLRFSGQADKLEDLGHQVNCLVPGLYDGLDRGGNRFSCAMSDGDTWEEHRDAIHRVLGQLRTVIKNAQALDFVLQIDIAIEPEDYSSRWITELSLSSELLHVLQKYEIGVDVTVYGHGK